MKKEEEEENGNERGGWKENRTLAALKVMLLKETVPVESWILRKLAVEELTNPA
jgi:hypothetical protein